MNKGKRRQIFQRLAAENPSPTTELKYSSVFELLISVILSAQATDISVNQATEKLYVIAHTPEKIYALGEKKLKSYIKNIGLYNTKANNIIKTCEMLIDEYDSQVPQTRTALEKLPGVGRKTANVILNTAFKQPTMAVDTHIFRISNRTQLAPGKNVRVVEEKLLKFTAKAYLLNAHHWLLLHGRYTCVARKPKCAGCMINDLCEYKDKTA